MDKEKIIKYKNMIGKLESLVKEKKKLDFTIKRLKENIDEFETNHLSFTIENIIKQEKKIIINQTK